METTAERQTELSSRIGLGKIIDEIENWFEVIDGLRNGLIENIIEPEKYAYQITKVIGAVEPKIQELKEYYEDNF